MTGEERGGVWPAGRSVLVAVSVLALVVAGAVLVTVSSGAKRRLERSESYPARRDVRLSVDAGTVRVRTGPAGQPISVRRVERWSLGEVRPQAQVQDDGDGLVIRGRCPKVISVGLGSECALDIDLVVPAGTRISVETREAEVDVAGDLDRLTVRSAFSSAHLSACVRSLDVQVATGDVDGALTCLPDRAHVEVLTGDLRLAVPPGRYRVVAEAALGDVQISPGVVAAVDAPRALELRAGTGDIVVAG